MGGGQGLRFGKCSQWQDQRAHRHIQGRLPAQDMVRDGPFQGRQPRGEDGGVVKEAAERLRNFRCCLRAVPSHWSTVRRSRTA